MHGNQWVLKIAVLKYYSVSKRGTTAKSNPKQATDPISLHTKFGDNSSNTFPLNERKPCVTPDIGRRTSDGGKSKNNISTPQGGGHNKSTRYQVVSNVGFLCIVLTLTDLSFYTSHIHHYKLIVNGVYIDEVFFINKLPDGTFNIHCVYLVLLLLKLADSVAFH